MTDPAAQTTEKKMRPMSRAVIARQRAASMPGGECGGFAWEQLEAQHYAAQTRGEAAHVIDLIERRFCGDCPAREACALWAAAERYDGLAAGAAYSQGRRKPRSWTVPRAGRQRRTKKTEQPRQPDESTVQRAS